MGLYLKFLKGDIRWKEESVKKEWGCWILELKANALRRTMHFRSFKTELLTSFCCCLSICIQISFVVGNDEFSPCPFSSSTTHSLLKSVTVRINMTISIRIWTALVVQWLGVHMPLQGTQVQSLVCKDSTHRNSKISVPQLLNQSTLEPVLGN